jgi:hypothetical protein
MTPVSPSNSDHTPCSDLPCCRCAGVCDDATATCFCDGANLGRVPALPGSPAGSPPIRPGRLLHGNCQRLRTDDRGRPLQWGPAGGVKYEDIYGPQVCMSCTWPCRCAEARPSNTLAKQCVPASKLGRTALLPLCSNNPDRVHPP